MENDRAQRYAKSLEKTIQNNHHFLKEKVKEFQEICLRVTPERNVPPEIVMDIREGYKEIRNRLGEIKAIQQLLQGKYRQFFSRDAVRDKEILEFGFIVKNCYSKFEYILIQKEAQKKAARREGERLDSEGFPGRWFRSKENEVTFIRNLRGLGELDYQPPSTDEKRTVTANRPRGLTLFLFSGDGKSLDTIQERIRLREHDIMERYKNEEIHGLLAHLREIDPLHVEMKFKQIVAVPEFSRLKCLLLPVCSEKDLKGELFGKFPTVLQEMKEGEVRTLSIDTLS